MESYLLDTLPVCTARSKRSGERCKNYASKGKQVCRIHGGRSTGAKTEAGKIKQQKARLKHGMKSKEAIAERRATREFIKECKSLLG